MIRIRISPIGIERMAAARDFVTSFPPAAERLLIGAGRDVVDHFARTISVSLGATFGLHRFTLTQLAAHLATAELARRGLSHSTTLGAEAVVARSAFEALERQALDYFSPVARLPGFAPALASTLAELRLAGSDPDSLSGLAASGRDLAWLLRIFEEQLEKAAVADRAGLFRAATRALDEPGEARYVGWPMLFLDASAASAAELDFLRALTARSSDVLLTVPEGDRRTIDALRSFASAESAAPPRQSPGSSLARLRSNLFGPRSLGEAEADGSVCLFSAPDEGRECTEIARRILDQARGGVRFDEMAILLRAPGAYASLLETALNRAGIPAFFTRGSRRPDPSGRAFLAILACAAERLSARRFAEYLSLGQVPGLDPSGSPLPTAAPWIPAEDEALRPAAVPAASEEPGAGPAPGTEGAEATSDTVEAPALEGTLRAPWQWEKLLVEAAVIGGQDRWARRLEGLEAELRLQRDRLKEEEPESPRALATERDLKNLVHLRAFALPLISTLADLPAAARWGEWLERLKGLAPRVLRRPERVLGLLAELEPMEHAGPVALDEVRAILASRLTSLEPERPPREYGRVFLGTPEQARGRTFEVVFVPGVAERIFPQRVSEDPILLDELRRRLGPALRVQDDRVESERLQLRLAAGSARRHIYFSYPRLDVAQARQRVPSFYALDVQRASRGKLPKFEELEAEARREADAALAWPAPTDPARAIDDMEYDLAVLGGLLRQGAGESSEGRARYLLELNPHLARSLRARWARWRKSWSGADGLCERTPVAAAALEPHRLAARPYSVSALQNFALCPYKFALSTIHRLEPRPDAVYLAQMDPLTRGSIFHRVLAEFMRQLQAAGSLPVTGANLAEAQRRLDETIDRVEEKYRDDLAPAILQVWRDSIEGIRTDLRGWLQRAAESPSDWIPIHFELGIGFAPEEGRDPASLRDPVVLEGGYLLHGIVDVIERRAGVADEMRVTDYKTSANRTQDGMVVGGGELLQPVLYGLAVEIAKQARVTEGRLYFCTSVGGFTARPVKLHDVARLRGRQVLEIIDQAVERAFLPPAPKERACSWCDFREVCGPCEEIRAARKDQSRLDDLNTLRGLP